MPRFAVSLLLAALSFVGSACRGPGFPPEVPGPELELGLTLRPDPLAVDLAFSFPGDADGETFVELSREWGGVGQEREDLVDVRVTAETIDAELPLVPDGPHRWKVTHEPDVRLTVRARLPRNAEDFRAGFDDRKYYRPILEPGLLHAPGLFHAIGHLFLPVPDHLDWDAVHSLELRYRGFAEAGWEVVDSFGTGSGPRRVRTTLGELRHALFLAGDLDLQERSVAGGPVVVAVADHGWDFEPEELAELVTRIVGIEREMMDDRDAAHYLVSAIAVGPRQDRGFSFGGTGLSHSFALFLQPNVDLALDGYSGIAVRRLLAHECFHEWNGVRIRLDDDEAESYWFSEGFTDHVARMVLREAGWLDDTAYAASFSDTLKLYHTSEARNRSAAELGATFWDGGAAQSQPYQRGDIVAALVDHALREASGGGEGLLDLMRALLHEADTTGKRFGTEDLLARLHGRLKAETVERIRRVVVDGETAALPDGVLGPGFELGERSIFAWDPGFDVRASIDAKRAVGVRPDSPAARAGIAENQELTNFSVYFDDPERELRLTVVDEGESRDVAYFPRGAATRVPEVRAVAQGDG